MYNFICIKNNRTVSVGQEFICHFNPFSDCFQIYKIGEDKIYEHCTVKDFNEHFMRKDIYRQKQIEEILK